ncbi:hypothetical protein [Egbenema bharatensis]|uniref:hypothetical protein n=1 Tax=Egbenema bharatensis TaxID=3463334 RepID=UPI003A882450
MPLSYYLPSAIRRSPLHCWSVGIPAAQKLSSLLTPHSSLLTPHSSLLTLTPHSSPSPHLHLKLDA